jgi:hypothetical protein
MGKKLDGAVVVVTGASSGIGRATGLAFAERGVRVVVAARRVDALEELARECQAAGGQALSVPTDTHRRGGRGRAGPTCRRAVRSYRRLGQQRRCLPARPAGGDSARGLQEGAGDQFLRVRSWGPGGAAPVPRAGPRRADQQRLGLLPRRRTLADRLCEQQVRRPRVLRGAPSRELADLPDVHVCTVSPSPIDTPNFASAANYSGRAVKAPPPTYPPEQVASAILASALYPERERIVGGAGRLVTVTEAVAPRRFEGVNPSLCQQAPVRRRASPRHRRQPARTRLRRPRRGPRRLAAPARPAAPAPPVGRGRTTGRLVIVLGHGARWSRAPHYSTPRLVGRPTEVLSSKRARSGDGSVVPSDGRTAPATVRREGLTNGPIDH